jgi:leader peptidase (prepilin peptidase)/N-methyltransferase
VTAAIAFVCGLLGLCVGSFLNVVIWRVPRKESVVRPRSHCPACDTVVGSTDLVPVFSWLRLRGRCRACQEPIPMRYPLVEISSAVLFAAIGTRFHDSWALPAYLLMAAALLAISVIDLEHYIVPNRIVYPVGFATVPLLALAAVFTTDGWDSLVRALLGGVVAFVFLFTLHFIQPRGMGFGDVRLSFLLGIWLGWLGWWEVALGLFLGFLFGALLGLLLMGVKRRGRKQHIPFAPFLAAGTLVTVLWGAHLIAWYQG